MAHTTSGSTTINWSGTTNTSSTTQVHIVGEQEPIPISGTQFGGNPPQAQGQQCNESKRHSHEEKAVFHGMKSAFRFVSSGSKGVDDTQAWEALHIAGRVGKAYLQSEGYSYDPDKSEEYLKDNFLDKFRSETKIIERAIKRAWKKIDGGNHKGGARIAVSLADKYVEDFTPP